MESALLIILGLATGGAAGWIAGNARTVRIRSEAAGDRAALEERLRLREEQIATIEREGADLQAKIERAVAEKGDLLTRLGEVQARVEVERKTWEEKFALLEEAKSRLSDAFKTLSSEALDQSNARFVEMAKSTLETFHERARGDLTQRENAIASLVAPIQEQLKKVDTQIGEIEKARTQAYGSITEQVKLLAETQRKLHSETSNLVTALRAPQVRGRWGEIQLRRVVELAGMIDYCDFVEQESRATDEGNLLRPDLIVRLPGGKNVVVDSKAPLAAYLESLEARSDDERDRRLADHSRQVRVHMEKLGGKQYWSQFNPTPEFVVMFLPGETFFSAALQKDAALIEYGVEKGVIPSSPTTLIALLRAVAYGWRQEKIARNAEAISQLGRDLYERIATMAEHFQKVGRDIDSAARTYNKAVASFQTRVIPQARKFPELGVVETKKLTDLAPVETATQALQIPERKNANEEITTDLRES